MEVLRAGSPFEPLFSPVPLDDSAWGYQVSCTCRNHPLCRIDVIFRARTWGIKCDHFTFTPLNVSATVFPKGAQEEPSFFEVEDARGLVSYLERKPTPSFIEVVKGMIDLFITGTHNGTYETRLKEVLALIRIMESDQILTLINFLTEQMNGYSQHNQFNCQQLYYTFTSLLQRIYRQRNDETRTLVIDPVAVTTFLKRICKQLNENSLDYFIRIKTIKSFFELIVFLKIELILENDDVHKERQDYFNCWTHDISQKRLESARGKYNSSKEESAPKVRSSKEVKPLNGHSFFESATYKSNALDIDYMEDFCTEVVTLLTTEKSTQKLERVMDDMFISFPPLSKEKNGAHPPPLTEQFAEFKEIMAKPNWFILVLSLKDVIIRQNVRHFFDLIPMLKSLGMESYCRHPYIIRGLIDISEYILFNFSHLDKEAGISALSLLIEIYNSNQPAKKNTTIFTINEMLHKKERFKLYQDNIQNIIEEILHRYLSMDLPSDNLSEGVLNELMKLRKVKPSDTDPKAPFPNTLFQQTITEVAPWFRIFQNISKKFFKSNLVSGNYLNLDIYDSRRLFSLNVKIKRNPKSFKQPLRSKLKEFLGPTSTAQVLLIHGQAAGGKTDAIRQEIAHLLRYYEEDNYMPIMVTLEKDKKLEETIRSTFNFDLPLEHAPKLTKKKVVWVVDGFDLEPKEQRRVYNLAPFNDYPHKKIFICRKGFIPSGEYQYAILDDTKKIDVISLLPITENKEMETYLKNRFNRNDPIPNIQIKISIDYLNNQPEVQAIIKYPFFLRVFGDVFPLLWDAANSSFKKINEVSDIFTPWLLWEIFYYRFLQREKENIGMRGEKDDRKFIEYALQFATTHKVYPKLNWFQSDHHGLSYFKTNVLSDDPSVLYKRRTCPLIVVKKRLEFMHPKFFEYFIFLAENSSAFDAVVTRFNKRIYDQSNLINLK